MTRIAHWVAAALLVTAIFVTIYVVMQQLERQNADDTPIRVASEVEAQLRAGDVLTAGLDAGNVDLGLSGEPFFIVFDSGGKPVAGTARLNGALPSVPAGVIRAGRAGGDRVTWQPTATLRFATVEVKAGSDVVLAGQSLAPTEQRIDRLGLTILAAWLVTLTAMVVFYFVIRWLDRTEPARAVTR